MNFEEIKVLSSSPERFLKINGKTIETRPIKGTRPRGKNEEEATSLNMTF
jgi:para-aminobenzoate synthetase component 1